MSKSRCAAALSLLALFVLGGFGIAFAATNPDEADKMCPQVTDTRVYRSDEPHLAKFYENGKGPFENLYGTICKDIESKQVAANGICVGPHTCRADFCDGKPCAVPRPDQLKGDRKSTRLNSSHRL